MPSSPLRTSFELKARAARVRERKKDRERSMLVGGEISESGGFPNNRECAMHSRIALVTLSTNGTRVRVRMYILDKEKKQGTRRNIETETQR